MHAIYATYFSPIPVPVTKARLPTPFPVSVTKAPVSVYPASSHHLFQGAMLAHRLPPVNCPHTHRAFLRPPLPTPWWLSVSLFLIQPNFYHLTIINCCFAVSVHSLILSPDNHLYLFLFFSKNLWPPHTPRFCFAPFDLLLSPSSVSVSLNPHCIYPDNHLYLKSLFLFKYKKNCQLFHPHNVLSPPNPLPTACFYHNHNLTTICFLSPYFSLNSKCCHVSAPQKGCYPKYSLAPFFANAYCYHHCCCENMLVKIYKSPISNKLLVHTNFHAMVSPLWVSMYYEKGLSEE